MKKTFFLLIAGFFCSISLKAQYLPDPISKSTDPNLASDIASDFWPRNDGVTKFHYGIDYPRANGAKANAIEDADIDAFEEWDNDNAYIRIVNGNRKWRYMHVESDKYPKNGTPPSLALRSNEDESGNVLGQLLRGYITYSNNVFSIIRIKK